MIPRFNGKPATIRVRLRAYLAAILRKGTRTYSINFAKLAKSFGCSQRAVEKALRQLRDEPRTFIFKTVRVGRVYVATVSDRTRLQEGSFSYGKKKSNNTAQAPHLTSPASSSGWRTNLPAPAKILALAAWIASRELSKAHKGASRIHFRRAHAFNFAAAALHAGHAREDIVTAYHRAVRDVCEDLANLPADIRWEPSSAIRIARRRLADGIEVARRVAIRRASLAKGRDVIGHGGTELLHQLGAVISAGIPDDNDSVWEAAA